MPKKVTMWECDLCHVRHDSEEEASNCCQIEDLEVRRKWCENCDNDYYNTHEHMTGKGCWSLSDAKRVLKKEVHVDQVPPWTQEPIIVLSCFHQKRYVYVGPEQTH